MKKILTGITIICICTIIVSFFEITGSKMIEPQLCISTSAWANEDAAGFKKTRRKNLVACLKKNNSKDKIEECVSEFSMMFRSGRVEDPGPCELKECPNAKRWVASRCKKILGKKNNLRKACAKKAISIDCSFVCFEGGM